MYFVYVLANEQKRLYIGYTRDIRQRYTQHQRGQVYTTKRIGGKWTLLYYECGTSQDDAIRRERYLKTGPGRKFLQKRLQEALQSWVGTEAVKRGRL